MDAKKYSFGFGAYGAGDDLTVAQRAYVVHILGMSASRTRRETPMDDVAARKEWRGIENACTRELRRLTRVGGV